MEGKPLAWIATAAIYWVHGDHLGTPQMLTDAAGAAVWDANYRPFGEATVTGALTFNLRFPGQYEDAETGLHYNYFRDYDPATGRYIQSDPIGLGGGWNTFAYVGGNPVTRVDLFGLMARKGPFGCKSTWVGSGSIRNVFKVHEIVDSVRNEWNSELIDWEFGAPGPWDEVPESKTGWVAFLISLTNPVFRNCEWEVTTGTKWEEATRMAWSDFVVTCRTCKRKWSMEKREVYGPFDDSTKPEPFRYEKYLGCWDSWVNMEALLGGLSSAL